MEVFIGKVVDMEMKWRGITFISLVVFFVLLSSLQAAEPLPDTGQTKFYDNGNEIIGTPPAQGEAFYGQDAHYTRERSYTKLNTNGSEWVEGDPQWVMVRDDVTGLIWEVKTDDGSIHDCDNMYTWSNAQSVFIAKLKADGFAGSDKWRLPTVKELSYLTGCSSYSPAIDIVYFPQTQSTNYWSSTTGANYTIWAWCVSFGSGFVDYYGKTDSHYVRAVRSGQ